MNKDELSGLIQEAVLIAQKEGKLPCFDIPEIPINYSEKKEFGDYNTPSLFLLPNKSIKSRNQ